MGDIVSLVEKASQDLGEENIKKAEENLKKGQFSMQDYLTQLRQMKKMGGIEGIMSFMPGVSKMKSQMDSPKSCAAFSTRDTMSPIPRILFAILSG